MKELISKISNETIVNKFLNITTIPIVLFIALISYASILGKLTLVESIGLGIIAFLGIIILLLITISMDIRKILNNEK